MCEESSDTEARSTEVLRPQQSNAHRLADDELHTTITGCPKQSNDHSLCSSTHIASCAA